MTALAVPTLFAFPSMTAVGPGGYGPYQTGLGGEFTFQSADLASIINGYSTLTKNQVAGATPNFQTFCVEGNEEINPNETVSVVFNTQSVFTGTPLSVGAALLYSEFAQGTLANYSYGVGRSGTPTSSAAQLQNAIWAFMGGQEGQNLATLYNGGVILGGNIFVIDAVNAIGSLAAADAAAAAGQDGVYVLNTWDGGVGVQGAQRQDMLIWTTPDGGTTVMLLGMGLMGLVFISRRFALAR